MGLGAFWVCQALFSKIFGKLENFRILFIALVFSYHTCSLSYVAPKLSKNEKNPKILRNFRKNGQNLSFSSVQSKSKRADRTMKFGDLQRFLVNKSIFGEILVQKLFSAKMAISHLIVIKNAFLGHFFEIATNVVFSNRC